MVAAPTPAVGRSGVLIATQASLVSAGTERMLVDFGRASLLGKVRSQPQRVGEVLDKARTDGIGVTVDAVRSKLAQPIPLGYSSAGVVLEVGADVRGVAVGDLVAAAGPHAETATVPVNLTAVLPDGVTAVDAAFATVGSIALQGLRLAQPTVGERFVVIGLGLIGLLAVQLLQAQGCTVLGIDPNPDRRRLAEGFGATTVAPSDDVLQAAAQHSAGRGVDGVLVCASTTSSEPIHQAAQMCRQRGRIILVGVTGLELDRADFYEKELSFQVSAAYGPGRYDPTYESGGHDYPLGFVRWTAGRNMEAVLGLIGSGRLDVGTLITHRFAFDDAPEAYQALVSDRDAPRHRAHLSRAGGRTRPRPGAAPARRRHRRVPRRGAPRWGCSAPATSPRRCCCRPCATPGPPSTPSSRSAAPRRPWPPAPSAPVTPAAIRPTCSVGPRSTPWWWPPATTPTPATWSGRCAPASTSSSRSRSPSTPSSWPRCARASRT